MTKPLLMPALVARQSGTSSGPARRRTVAAQAFSCGGDVALLGEGRGPFLAGVGSFFAAHLSYVAAFRSRSSVGVLATRGRRATLLVGSASAAGMALAAARKDRTLGLPVLGYGVTLATMVASAAAVDQDRGRGLVLAGASLFLLSDTLLGARTFVAPDAPLEGAVMATYTAAQWLIGEGMSRS
jgi:uncharacterized membrane protein YhhN